MIKVDTIIGILYLTIIVFIIVFLVNILFVYIPLLVLQYVGVTGLPAMVIVSIIALMYGIPYIIDNIRRC